MRAVSLVLAMAGAALPSIASAETKTATRTVTLEQRERIKERLRKELSEEIKEELRAEMSQATPPPPVESTTLDSEQHRWAEPTASPLNFIELDGYFRFRYGFFTNLDLGTYRLLEAGGSAGPFRPPEAPPTPLCMTEPRCATRDPGASLGGANARLRLEPVLNVFEDVKIKAQIDILDNLVLGSTPDGFPKNPAVPLITFSQTQLPPSDEVNALADSIRAKRVWAEVMTPLGQIRVGRMASHFGMGILENGGVGLDSDGGDTVDSIRFAAKLGDHYIIPGFDWMASGPTSALRLSGTDPRGDPTGQPFDRSQIDDVDQLFVIVSRFDKEDEIQERLDRGEQSINYGGYLSWRTQLYDSPDYEAAGKIEDQARVAEQERVGAELFTLSLWARWVRAHMRLEAEAVGTLGAIDHYPLAGTPGGHTVDVLTLGGALSGEYKLLNDALTLRLLVLVASGDGAPGFGVRTLDRTSTPSNPTAGAPKPGDWDGPQERDGAIHNFVFDPDYHVDLVFWRELVGAVTDAFVFRPGIEYRLYEGLGARMDLVYSRALLASSTPSASRSDPSANLGVELDFKLFFETAEGFHAWLDYGVLFPLSGLRPADVEDTAIAQTLRAMVAVTF